MNTNKKLTLDVVCIFIYDGLDSQKIKYTTNEYGTIFSNIDN